jgi:hypothetical protein
VTPVERLAAWCAARPHVALWDAERALLVDVFSGKSLRLERVRDVVEKRAADTGESYLVVVRDDGRQLALASAGVAFPPDARNVGALPLPPVVCWRDFANVAGRVAHVLEAHPDEPPSRELGDMLLYCIALVDGARTAGFEVGDEERRLESLLATLERRR